MRQIFIYLNMRNNSLSHLIFQGPQTAIMADNDARNPNPSETKTQYIAALAGK